MLETTKDTEFVVSQERISLFIETSISSTSAQSLKEPNSTTFASKGMKDVSILTIANL